MRPAQRGLNRLQNRDFVAVKEAVDSLANTPRPNGVEKISGSVDVYRVRQGDYRIVYSIDDQQQLITVLRIGHRREIYRSL